MAAAELCSRVDARLGRNGGTYTSDEKDPVTDSGKSGQCVSTGGVACACSLYSPRV